MIRKHPKKTVWITAVVVLAVIAVILGSVIAGKLGDDSFYVRSRQHQGDAVVDEVIDITAAQSEFDLSENAEVTFSMGLGGFAMEDYEVYVTIEAAGCKINGEQDSYRKDYPDFYQEKYRVEYEKGFGVKTAAKYHEDLVIEFPQENKKGSVLLSLHIKSDRANYDSTCEIEIPYTIGGSRLTLIGD